MALIGDNFVFIHVYRCGGMSLREVLPGEHILPGHPTASETREFLGENEWTKRYSFGFVRNPFDWCVSLYEYARQLQSNHFDYTTISQTDFEDFIAYLVDQLALGYPGNRGYYRLVDALCGKDNNILVTMIGRFETYITSSRGILDVIQLPFIRVPRINMASYRRESLIDYYRSDKVVEAVISSFGDDFDTFDYPKTLPK